jgi:Tfp pilus assembly protein PilP
MTPHLRRRLIGLCLVPAVLAASLSAQPPAPPDPAPAAPPVDDQAPPSPPPAFTYSSEGRRDPFLSLINRGVTDPRAGLAGRQLDGIGGLTVAEIVIRGIVQSRSGFLAMVQGPSGRTFVVRAGDQLLDGRIRSITADALIILQEVNDPLSLQKQREVRKPLRGGREGN